MMTVKSLPKARLSTLGMPSGLEYGTHVPFTGPVGMGFSDRSFISVAALIAQRMGGYVQLRRKYKFQTTHPLCESMVAGTEVSESLRMDSVGWNAQLDS